MFKHGIILLTLFLLSSIVMAHDDFGNEHAEIPAWVVFTGAIVLFSIALFLIKRGRDIDMQ